MEQPRPSTPRQMRRLASDHNFVLGAQARAPRLGLWPFVATNLSLPAALCAGIICTIVVVAYTAITSQQVLECPQWAVGCRMVDRWTAENLGTIQGIITLIYLIGMAALGYAALIFCQAAIWPLAHKQWFTLKGFDGYLSTTRGSLMSVPSAITSVKSLAAGGVLIAALTVILLPVAGPPLVGHAFTPAWQEVQLRSNYTPGGGISEVYAQTNPPTSVIVQALANYDLWATDPASEPLSMYRDWYINRQTLSQRGNFSAHAVKLETSVSCTPYDIQQFTRDNRFWNGFKTNMSRTNSDSPGDKVSGSEVWFRPQPQLTLWANDFDFVSPTTTRTTLIFAAINGTIEGGKSTPLQFRNLTSVSAVACDIKISALDSVLNIGNASAATGSESSLLPTLSSISTLALPTTNSSLNDLLLWFTVSPLLSGSSIDGAQPMFLNSSSSSHLPLPFTSTLPRVSADQNTYTIPGLESFIHLSIGALAQSTSSSSSSPSVPGSDEPSSTPAATIIITTTYRTKKLSTPRAYLLLIPPLLVIAIAASLAVWNSAAHRELGIPVMRLASTGELVKSTQTAYLRELASTDAAKTYLPNELAGVRVRYGVDKRGIVGLGAPNQAEGFVAPQNKAEGGMGVAAGPPRSLRESESQPVVGGV
ncbi:hypothetical protein QBC42DRAFT_173332 [Cladorrhinum samala]|uniref:Uncharacterized protein n=1 Tax=Cladorrhinum samala TaxID=585594 RepID=A0AAV9HWS1_9PEZI|nr:hypothetical protein QBC42DRAFT_173332 [Cladorrhinum samala]